MGAIKKTVSIDENVVKNAIGIAPNFSAIVETALIEYIQHYRIKKAINSFGKWAERKESSAEIVSNLRSQDDREYVTRNDPSKE